jgi:site-specific DNA-adenine methylase
MAGNADDEARRRATGDDDVLERVVSRDKIEKLAPAGVFGYAAGKSIIAKRLVKHFPAHKAYTEPFCGSAAMFFTKDACPVEILNDADEEVAFAHKAIKEITPADLKTLARKQWSGSAETFMKARAMKPKTDVDRLYKFLYLVNFSYGKGRKSFNPGAHGATSGIAGRVAKFQPRYKTATVLHGDYAKAISDHDGPDAFHFLDPPYVGYKAGGGGVGEGKFNEQDFRKVMEGIKGKFLLTYGVKGKLDVSGFDVKRMRQPRTIRTMRGVGGSQFLTHLLVSNYKIAAKSLGDGIELDDVLEIIEVDDQGTRIVVTGGERVSVSVPEAIGGPTVADVQLSAIGKSLQLDIVWKGGGWSFDVARPDAPDPVADVASFGVNLRKSFSTEGSRFFRAMTMGVPATPYQKSASASSTHVDTIHVEDGVQTETSREFFLTKGDEFVGQLIMERDLSLGEKYPWVATLIDSKFVPNAVLKGAVLPIGVSALPSCMEKALPAEFRYWEKSDAAEAAEAALALRRSGLLEKTAVARVGDSLEMVTASYEVAEPRFDPLPDEWPLSKACSLLAKDQKLVEVFASEALVDGIGDAVAFVDAGAADDGTLAAIVPTLKAYAGSYVATGSDSSGMRAAFKSLGRPFFFRPGMGASADATKRLFVASFGVRGDDVLWLDKVEDDEDEEPKVYNTPSDDTGDLGKSVVDELKEAGPPNEWSGAVASILGPEKRKELKSAWEALSPAEKTRVEEAFLANMEKAEWSTAYVNDLDDKDFLHIEAGGKKDASGRTEPRSLRHFPYRGKDGEIDDAHLRNAIAQAPKSSLPKTVIDDVQARGRELIARKGAEFNNPERGGAGEPRRRGEEAAAKGDWDSLGGSIPGTLSPAQGSNPQWDIAGNPKIRKPDKTKKILVLSKADDDAKDDDERYVLGIVLEPDTVDAQEDIYSAPEVRDAAHKYMAEFQNRGFMHKEIVNGKVDLLESYLAPADFKVGDQDVKKGTWVMAVRVKDDKLWEATKKGELTGFSIGGSANRQPDPQADAKHKAEKYATRKAAAKKKVVFQGIPVSVDRPKGFVQTGKDKDGNAWTRTYTTDYGFIPRTKGGDGEGLDVFLGPNGNSPFAYWVTQKKDDGSFDELKVVLGCDTAEQARKLYLDHVPEKYFDGIREGSVAHIQSLLNQEPTGHIE